jgi:3-oxoacyl-[acyl-carrier protein] reductase
MFLHQMITTKILLSIVTFIVFLICYTKSMHSTSTMCSGSVAAPTSCSGTFLQSFLGLDGKVALVSGSTAGLGRAIVETLCQAGCKVIVNGRYPERTEQAAKEIADKCCPNDTNRVIAVHGDTSDTEQAQAIADKIQETFGVLDILVNNAGMNLPEASFEDQYTPDQWQKISNVNLMGPMNMVKATLPLLKRSNAGRIVNVASMIGHVGSPTNPLYTMTKSAMVVFTKSLAADLAGTTKITVNSISPGAFATEMNVSTTSHHT